MVHHPRRLRRALAALLVGVAVSVAACSGDDTTGTTTTTIPTEPSTASALAATIEAVVVELYGDEVERKVIVAPLYEGTAFGIEVQAEVITVLRPMIDTQFIDNAELALVDDGAAVIEDAILLRLALNDLPGQGAKVTGELWASADDITDLTAEVSWSGETWVAAVVLG